MKSEVVPSDSRYIPLTQQKWCCVPTCIQIVMLKHNIALIPAELIGYHMGLTVPKDAKKYFWKARTGKRPAAGWGTQIGKPEYGPNRVFKKLKIPLVMSWSLIHKFKTLGAFKEYLGKVEESGKDILVCFDWPTLFDKNEKDHWGHVCVLDKVDLNKEIVRIIDPSANSGKWIEVKIEDMYKSMLFHGRKNGGGFWELEFVDRHVLSP